MDGRRPAGYTLAEEAHERVRRPAAPPDPAAQEIIVPVEFIGLVAWADNSLAELRGQFGRHHLIGVKREQPRALG